MARRKHTILVDPSRPDIKEVVRDMNQRGYVYAGKRNGMAVYTREENNISDTVREHYFLVYSLAGVFFIVVAIALVAVILLS